MKHSFFYKFFFVSTIFLGLLIGAEVFLRCQNFVQLDGFGDQNPWNPVLHHGRGDFVINSYGEGCNGEGIKMLLLGDSWMEDANLSQAIGEGFANESGRCVETINGGNSSYSPSLYLLKARRAFENFGQFDYVVINIDETDIGDEWVRYRIPLRRNESGKIISVDFEEDLHSQFIWNGKLWAEDSELYLARFLKFALYYNVLVPKFYDFTFSPDYNELMKYVFDPLTRSLYVKEIEYFNLILSEMIGEISRYVSGSEKIVLTFHPHYQGLVEFEVNKNNKYLPIVSESLCRQKNRFDVSILDASDSLDKIHGGYLTSNTFIEGDMFSHLTQDGAKRYGRWIARQLEFK